MAVLEKTSTEHAVAHRKVGQPQVVPRFVIPARHHRSAPEGLDMRYPEVSGLDDTSSKMKPAGRSAWRARSDVAAVARLHAAVWQVVIAGCCQTSLSRRKSSSALSAWQGAVMTIRPCWWWRRCRTRYLSSAWAVTRWRDAPAATTGEVWRDSRCA